MAIVLRLLCQEKYGLHPLNTVSSSGVFEWSGGGNEIYTDVGPNAYLPNCFHLNGDNIYWGDPFVFEPTDPGCISFWLKRDSAANADTIFLDDSANTTISFNAASHTLVAYEDGGTPFGSLATGTDTTQWRHYALNLKTDGDIDLYISGALVGTVGTRSSGFMGFGATGGDNISICGIYIFDEVLSLPAIQELATGNSGVKTINRIEVDPGAYTQLVPATITGNLSTTVTGPGGGGSGYTYSGYNMGGGGGGCGVVTISGAVIASEGGVDLDYEVGDGGLGGSDATGTLGGASVITGVTAGMDFLCYGYSGYGGFESFGGYGGASSVSASDPGFVISSAQRTGGNGSMGSSGSNGGGGGSGACPTADGEGSVGANGGFSSGSGSGAGGSGAFFFPAVPPTNGEESGGGGGGGGYPYYSGANGASGRVTITFNYDPITITSNGGGPTAEIQVEEGETAVTTVTFEDEASEPVFGFAGGPDDDLFDFIDGVLSFPNPPDFETPLDADEDNIYEVWIRVSDVMGSADQTLFIEVTDVEEGPVPTITTTEDEYEVEEDEFDELEIATFEATIEDEVAFIWEIEGVDSALFEIGEETGTLSFIDRPNHEDPADDDLDNVYELTIKATSINGSDTLPITVTVIDVDPPTLGDAPFINPFKSSFQDPFKGPIED